ncbi:MAG: hypothetical protein ABSG08_22015 [Terriglobales bacterium]|jgi:hypothetical protein
MMGSARTIAQVILGLSIALSSTGQAPASAFALAKPADEEGALRAFAAIHPIDVHVHVFKTDPAFQKMLEGLNVKLLNILVMDDTLPYRKQLRPQIDDALALVRSSRGHIALCRPAGRRRRFPNCRITRRNHPGPRGSGKKKHKKCCVGAIIN